MTTTKTKHTQGPWMIGDNGKVFHGSTQICKLMGNHRLFGACTEEDIANTRLIAAAPELLEALKLIVEGNTMKGKEGFTHADVIQKHYQIARNAISKAEGTL